MNKLQFVALIATTAGSFVSVLLAWINSNVRLSRLEATFDASNAKHDSALTQLRNSTDSNMLEIRGRLAIIDNHLMTFYTVTGKLDGRIDELSRK